MLKNQKLFYYISISYEHYLHVGFLLGCVFCDLYVACCDKCSFARSKGFTRAAGLSFVAVYFKLQYHVLQVAI